MTNGKIKAFAVIAASMFVLGSTGVLLGFKMKKGSDNSAKQYDENNVGVISCAAVEEEHIAETSDGMAKFADNELLVVAKAGTLRKKVEKLASSFGAEIVGEIEQTGDYQLRFENAATEDELNSIKEQILKSDIVESCGMNYISEMTPASIHRGSEYGKVGIDDAILSPFKVSGMWGHDYVGAPYAWELLDSVEDKINPVNVGLLDSGFNEHEDLDYAGIYNNPEGENNHGTHCAGIMAASSEDDTGICGIYPYGNGRLYASAHNMNYTKLAKRQWFTSSMSLKAGLSELIFRNVKVINVSLCFNWRSGKEDYKKNNGETVNCYRYKLLTKEFTEKSPIAADADYLIFIDTIYENNYYHDQTNQLADFLQRTLSLKYDFVICCAAGNDSSKNRHYDAKSTSFFTMIRENEYPGVYNRILVVGSVGTSMSGSAFLEKDKISDYSNNGTRVDIYAPGYMIRSTVGENQYKGNNIFDNCDGTSAASPFVAGAAADVWTVNNSLSGDQVKETVVNSYRNDSKDSVHVLNVPKAIISAANRTDGKGSSVESNKGMIMGWVYYNPKRGEKYNEKDFTAVTDAKIILYKQGDPKNKKQYLNTDSYGHFEAIVEPGEYTIGVESPKYGKAIANYENDGVITVEPNTVNTTIIHYPMQELPKKDEKKNEQKTEENKEEYSIIRFDVLDSETHEKIDRYNIGIVFVEDGKQVLKGYNPFVDYDSEYSLNLKLPYSDGKKYTMLMRVEGYNEACVEITLGDERDYVGEPTYLDRISNPDEIKEEEQTDSAVICFDVIAADTEEIIGRERIGIAFEDGDGRQILKDFDPFLHGSHDYSVELQFPHEKGREYILRVKVAGYKTSRIKIIISDTLYRVEEPVYLVRDYETDDYLTDGEKPVSMDFRPEDDYIPGSDDYVSRVNGNDFEHDVPQEQNTGWKEAYIDYVRRNELDIISTRRVLWLIDVDNDGIPELFECEVSGDGIMKASVHSYSRNSGKMTGVMSLGMCKVYFGRGGVVFIRPDDSMTGYVLSDGGFEPRNASQEMNLLAMKNIMSSEYTGSSDKLIESKILSY